MPFRWRGVSALSWVTDKHTSLELGHVPRLALPQHTGQYAAIRGTSSGFLSMFHNTSVFCEDFQRKEVSDPSLPSRSFHGFGPASLARCKTLSFTVPSEMEFLLFRAVQLVRFLLVVKFRVASHCLLPPSQCQHSTQHGKATHSTGLF